MNFFIFCIFKINRTKFLQNFHIKKYQLFQNLDLDRIVAQNLVDIGCYLRDHQ